MLLFAVCSTLLSQQYDGDDADDDEQQHVFTKRKFGVGEGVELGRLLSCRLRLMLLKIDDEELFILCVYAHIIYTYFNLDKR